MTILFNHIPKTGGTTLRVIFNKVYGIDQVYFIESKNIGHSLEIFRQMNQDERSNYKVIAGHGAEFFADYIKDPFRLTLIREPISLFISQYIYLKNSPNSPLTPKQPHRSKEHLFLPRVRYVGHLRTGRCGVAV